jgi:cytochrome P450
VLGQEVRDGDLIVLLLAAANRDTRADTPAALKDGEDGDQFNPLLNAKTTQWGFSAGRHRCPGQSLAITIVVEAVSYVIDHWKELDWQKMQYHYLPSLNARIPVFTQKAGTLIAQL